MGTNRQFSTQQQLLQNMVSSNLSSNGNQKIVTTGSNHNLFDNIPSITNSECDPGLSTLQILRENDINEDGNNNHNPNHNVPLQMGMGIGTGAGNSYYDQVMNQHNNATNMNMMNPFNGLMSFDDIPFPPIPIEPEIEIRDEEYGRSIRLDQDILALNLIQPWAYCIVNKLCKVFCYKSEFEADKYPNGYWYAIRVHANRVCMSHKLYSSLPCLVVFLFCDHRINPTYDQYTANCQTCH